MNSPVWQVSQLRRRVPPSDAFRLVDDVEAVAGGTDERAGATTVAARGHSLPEAVVEVAFDPAADLVRPDVQVSAYTFSTSEAALSVAAGASGHRARLRSNSARPLGVSASDDSV